MNQKNTKSNVFHIIRHTAPVAVFLFVTVTLIGAFAGEPPPSRPKPTTIKRPHSPESKAVWERFIIKSGNQEKAFTLVPPSKFKNHSSESMGGKDGGGGDPSEMVRFFLEINHQTFSAETLSLALMAFFDDNTNSFRVRLIAVLNSMRPEQIKNLRVRKVFEQMIQEGLLEDIASSPLIFKNRCFIEKEGKTMERGATALMSVPASPVCVDPVALAHSMGGIADSKLLFGFIIHEYAHHFGYEDAKYEIANELTLTLRNTILKERADSGISHGDILFTIANMIENNELPGLSIKADCVSRRSCFEN